MRNGVLVRRLGGRLAKLTKRHSEPQFRGELVQLDAEIVSAVNDLVNVVRTGHSRQAPFPSRGRLSSDFLCQKRLTSRRVHQGAHGRELLLDLSLLVQLRHSRRPGGTPHFAQPCPGSPNDFGRVAASLRRHLDQRVRVRLASEVRQSREARSDRRQGRANVLRLVRNTLRPLSLQLVHGRRRLVGFLRGKIAGIQPVFDHVEIGRQTAEIAPERVVFLAQLLPGALKRLVAAKRSVRP